MTRAGIPFQLRQGALYARNLLSSSHLESTRPVYFVLSAPRTGSHYFWSFLNSLPEVRLYGEILNPNLVYGLPPSVQGNSGLKALARWVNRSQSSVTGFKILNHHLSLRKLTLPKLNEKFPGSRFFMVYRRDMLSAYISTLVAEKTHQWELQKGETRKVEKVVFDLKAFKDWFACQLREYRDVLSDTEIREKTLLVCYENLEENPQNVFRNQVFPFLNRPPQDVQSPLRRQRSYQSIWEVVTNPEALKQVENNPKYQISVSRITPSTSSQSPPGN